MCGMLRWVPMDSGDRGLIWYEASSDSSVVPTPVRPDTGFATPTPPGRLYAWP